MNTEIDKTKLFRIILYIALSVIIFVVSILIFPLELFALTAIVVLITLRSIEQELSKIPKKDGAIHFR